MPQLQPRVGSNLQLRLIGQEKSRAAADRDANDRPCCQRLVYLSRRPVGSPLLDLYSSLDRKDLSRNILAPRGSPGKNGQKTEYQNLPLHSQ